MTNQISSKVYWRNPNEELAARVRAKSQGKTVSCYLRDLVMLDLYQSNSNLNNLNGVNEDKVFTPPTPIIPPDATFFKPGELEDYNKGNELSNEDLKKLLEE